MQTMNQQESKWYVSLTWLHWIVIVASFLLTLFAWYIAKNSTEAKIAGAFAREADQVIELITERMEKYEDALWSGVAAIHSQSHGIDHQEWQRFTKTLRLEQRYPGVNGIGVIRYISPENREQFLDVERESRPGFHIHPKHDKSEYWPIVYIEPIAANAEAIGLDMAHEKNRYTAATQARDSGTAQITGPIVLVQDAEKAPGFLFFAPYYELKATDTLAERREHFVGLVYAPFIVNKLMDGALDKDNRLIRIKISDAEQVLYDENADQLKDFDPNPLFQKEVSLNVYGRLWAIDIRSSLKFRAATQNHTPLFVLLSGLLIEGLIIALIASLSRRNQRMQLAIQRAEAKHQAFLDASGDGFWDWHIKSDYEYMSPKFWEMFGYLPKEKPHHPSAWQELIFQEDLAFAMRNFKNHVNTKGKAPFSQEVRYRHKNGSTITVLCRGQVVEWDAKGNPVRMIGTHTDITELKAKQKALETALDFQKLLMSVNTDLIFVKDDHFRILDANPAFINLYPPETRDKIVGYTTFEKYPKEQADEFLKEDKKALAEGVSEVIEPVDFPDGQKKVLLTKKIRFENVDGEVFILAIARDITELKNVENELVRTNAELEEFAYRTSHDLRSPLISSIKLLEITQGILKDGQIEKASSHLGLIHESLQKLLELVSDILKLAKLNHESLPVVPISIEAIVENSLKKMAYMDNFSRLQIQTNFDTQVSLKAPVEHITLVIENILSNAIKYQDDSKRDSFVHVSTQSEGDRLVLKICDNGLGIPEQSRAKLFQMFKRFHPKASYGSGLGLYMVKRSVEKMGGSIEAHNTGDGTEFVISIPLNL